LRHRGGERKKLVMPGRVRDIHVLSASAKDVDGRAWAGGRDAVVRPAMMEKYNPIGSEFVVGTARG
jgi:hypothetical protein